MKLVKDVCSVCNTESMHELIHSAKCKRSQYPAWHYQEQYKHDVLQCKSCGTVQLKISARFFDTNRYMVEARYPQVKTHMMPEWMTSLWDEESVLLDQVYDAANAGHYWLATMGIRAIVERALDKHTGDGHRTFGKKLDAACEKGSISIPQRDTLLSVIEAGNAAVHRQREPSREEVASLFGVMESFLASLFHHPAIAEAIGMNVENETPGPRSRPR